MIQYKIQCANGCGATTLTGSAVETWRSFKVRMAGRLPEGTVTVCGPCACQMTAEEVHQLGVAASNDAMAWRVVREAELVLREAHNQ